MEQKKSKRSIISTGKWVFNVPGVLETGSPMWPEITSDPLLPSSIPPSFPPSLPGVWLLATTPGLNALFQTSSAFMCLCQEAPLCPLSPSYALPSVLWPPSPSYVLSLSYVLSVLCLALILQLWFLCSIRLFPVFH